MMLSLLELKDHLTFICEKSGLIVKMLVKFVVAFLMLFLINTNIGYNSMINNMLMILGLAVIFACTPDAAGVMLICIVTIAEVYSVAPVLALSVLLVYLIVYFMYVRYDPVQALFILSIPFLYILKIQYVVPVLCGLFLTPVSIVSCAFGIIIYYIYSAIGQAALVYEEAGISDTINIYNTVVDSILNNRFMLFTIVVSAVVILVTYIIRRQKMSHASYIAIFAGIFISIISFLLATAFLDTSDSVINVLIGNVAGIIIAVVAQFFRMTLDYSGTKQVQFEDDEYYYYVKAVPKYSVSAPDKQVKRINAQVNTGNTANLQDAIQKIYDEQ